MHYCFHSSLEFLSGKLSRQSGQMLDRRFKLHDVPVSVEQWRILAMLLEYEAATISTIADALFLSLAPVSRQVKSLVALHLVSVKPGEHDKKQRFVSLTHKGRNMAKRCCGYGYDVVTVMMGDLAAEEKDTLLLLLKRCVQHAEEDGKEPTPNANKY